MRWIIALFVSPVLVLASYFIASQPLDLSFNGGDRLSYSCRDYWSPGLRGWQIELVQRGTTGNRVRNDRTTVQFDAHTRRRIELRIARSDLNSEER